MATVAGWEVAGRQGDVEGCDRDQGRRWEGTGRVRSEERWRGGRWQGEQRSMGEKGCGRGVRDGVWDGKDTFGKDYSG